ncbi:MAG: glycosyltransferase family 4 protein [Candidatus Pacebacteria bacterium]|nr:glycosyltransferase family 4 protein [Candidatus Paceibacterota bacterium]
MEDNIKRKKRILVLNYEFPPLGGGASPVSYDIAEKLSQTGDFDIDVVTMGYKGLPQYEEINKNFRVHRVKCWRSKKELCHPWEQATYLVSAWFTCNELLKKKNYDICHCHFIIPTGVLAFLLKKKFGLPYIVTSHGSDVLGYNARFKYLYPLLVKSWKKILDNAQKIILPSYFLKNEIKRVYSQLKDEKLVIIPAGFDTDKFISQEKKKYIFSSGRLLVNKGFQYLIQAVSDIDIGYEVHIAGDGPMMEELKIMSEKSKTRIVFHGWLDNNGKEYKGLLEQSAIFVLVSDYESFGMVLVEAMSAGCAIITTNTSGCSEVVDKAGILINPKDADGLRLVLNSVVNDPGYLLKLQQLARSRVKNNYDWGVTLKEYIKIL